MADGYDDADDDLLRHALDALSNPKEQAPSLRLYPVHSVLPAAPCRRIIYSTKGDWLAALTHGFAKLPADVAVVWRHGPLDSYHRNYVRAVVAHFAAPLVFIGDLDPLDLVTYATLASGPGAVSLEYGGISDAWLAACAEALASQFERVCIPMNPAERSGVQRLLQLRPELKSVIGARAVELLLSGRKLELEGATNPRLYSQAVVDDRIRAMFG
jgi:hypothetical protein